MKFPVTEKIVPAFNQYFLALALIALPAAALAGPPEDYDAGFKAYRAGDVAGAMEPLKRAADSGHGAAQALYGSLLDSADFDDEAAEYLQKSAAQGNADGQYGLAKLYLTHEVKAPSDDEVNRLMRSAAAQGHSRAIIALALAYVSRDARLGAAEPNDPEAGKLLVQAAELGDRSAIEEVERAYRTGAYGLAVDTAKADEWAERLAAQQGKKKGAKK